MMGRAGAAYLHTKTKEDLDATKHYRRMIYGVDLSPE